MTRTRGNVLTAVLGFLLIGLLAFNVVSYVRSVDQRDEARDQRGTAVEQAKAIAMPVVSACAGNDEVAVELERLGLCHQAQTVLQQPAPEKVDTDALAAQVTAMVLAQIRIPRDGRDGKDGQSPPCLDLPLRCQEPDDPDPNDPEVDDPEINDPDPVDDPELNDPEQQDEEVQEPEIQEPEINDPDPPDGNPCPGVWEPYLFVDGRAGYRCVVPESMSAR